MQILGFDTETTGTNPKDARILQAATSGGHMWYLKSAVMPSKGASRVHGIYPHHLDDPKFKPPKEQLADIRKTLTAPNINALCVFNAAYDIPLLNAELERHDLQPLPTDTIIFDPLVLDRKFRHGKGRRTLTALTQKYAIDITDANYHDAAFDATIALQVFYAQCEMFGLDGYHAKELSELTYQWRDEQERSFNDYKNAPYRLPTHSPAPQLPNS